MANTQATMHGIQAFICAPGGKKLQSERDALDLIGEALQQGIRLVLVPVERLADGSFQLKTGLAGQIVQKFVTYRLQLVVLGDISQYVARSHSFKDFAYESNRGTQVWFLADLQELDERLKQMHTP